jgi:hypothetical protein
MQYTVKMQANPGDVGKKIGDWHLNGERGRRHCYSTDRISEGKVVRRRRR